MNKKRKLGQFYTTNSEYIVSNLLDIFPENCTIVDPFAGKGDLLRLVKDKKIEAYDIDKKFEGCIERDTLKNPPDYKGKWIITNPPYLAKNKNKDKILYDIYKLNDLYKIAIKTIMNCEGGIIIIPVNFFSGKDYKLRNEFLSNYKIIKMNVFEEQVFEDTTYTVCSFSFIKHKQTKQNLEIIFLPSKEKCVFDINIENNFTIGYEFYKLLDSNHNIKRLKKGDPEPNSKLFLRATDTGSDNGRISLSVSDKFFYATNSDRTFASIVLEKDYTLEQQYLIAKRFNEILEKYRKKYHSLFLTNYRCSTSSYARKRINFDMVYDLINYIIKNEIKI